MISDSAIEAISKVGFPIIACIALYIDFRASLKENTHATIKMKEAIEKLIEEVNISNIRRLRK